MKLVQAVRLSIGRSVAIAPEAAQQLCEEGTLSQQNARLHQQVFVAAADLLSEPRVRLPQSAGRLLLTEFEHPAWSLLALSTPPVYSEAQTLQYLQQQVGLRLPLTASTWGEWLCRSLLATLQPLLLRYWGVLLLWACDEQRQLDERRPEVAWLYQQLLLNPELLEDPQALAEQTLWAILSLLHGTQPFEGTPRLLALTDALLTLSERTLVAPLPPASELEALLRWYLPSLTAQHSDQVARQLSGEAPADEQSRQSGAVIIQRPGEVALWRRKRNEVQLTVTASPHLSLPSGWKWKIKT